jgi:hypothetical protein
LDKDVVKMPSSPLYVNARNSTPEKVGFTVSGDESITMTILSSITDIVTEMDELAYPVDAVRVTVLTPSFVGVPVMSPVGDITSPFGRFGLVKEITGRSESVVAIN